MLSTINQADCKKKKKKNLVIIVNKRKLKQPKMFELNIPDFRTNQIVVNHKLDWQIILDTA